MTKAVISLGSNLGDRDAYLRTAIDQLKRVAFITAVSHFIETDPVGGPAQGKYKNAIVICDTQLSAYELLRELQSIEELAGRVREVRWGPRTLDLDLISFGEEICNDAELSLPHPRAHERFFVLAPWHEIEPDAILPGHGSISDLLKRL